MSVAYAHSLLEDLYEPLPSGLFVYKFDWDPTLVGFVLLSYLYIQGLRAFKGKTPVSWWQQGCFWFGMGCNALSLMPPLDPLSDRLFFMHMIQHMLLTMVGVPLMMFGAPFYVISRGLGPYVRRTFYWPLLKNAVLQAMHRVLAHPLVALCLFNINYWFWHVPRFYNWALLNDWIHLVEHGTMSVTAIYLWRCLIDPKPLKSSLSMGFRLLFLLAMMISSSILAAALTYSETVWYAYEGIPMPGWWSYRWTHLDDQRLGGLIMWVPGSFLMLIALTICFFVWVHRETHHGHGVEQDPMTA